MAEKKSFYLYHDYIEVFKTLTFEELGELMMAVLIYVNGETPPPLKGATLSVFTVMKMQLDRDKSRYDAKCARNSINGQKGGRPVVSERLSEKPKITERLISKPKKADTDKDKDTDTEKDTVKDKDKDTEKNIRDIAPTTKDKKQHYGDFKKVSLTDSEYCKLQDQYPSYYQVYIDRVDSYVASTGKKYSSHYATILNWMRKDNLMPEEQKEGCPY